MKEKQKTKKRSKTNLKKKSSYKKARSKKRVFQKKPLNSDFKFFISSALADRLTGLEKENQFSVNTEPFQQFIYNVKSDRPGNGQLYSVYPQERLNRPSELPFDPTEIRVRFKEMPIEMILNRIKDGGINLSPDFQRTEGIWDDQAQSRLIESLFIRIPIPVFYIDGSSDDEWLVVDGQQRLSSFKRFVIDKTLRLKGMEFYVELNGKSFDEIPKNLQRRFLESTISLYLIETGTPPEVKFSIFQRINTGGLPLSSQEIRHALFRGRAANLLNKIVNMNEFKLATDDGIQSERMIDRECALRAITFMRKKHTDYKVKSMDSYLNASMQELNKLSESDIEEVFNRFKRAMIINHQIFEKNAFRKFHLEGAVRYPINKGLFEVCTVMADHIKDRDLKYILQTKGKFLKSFVRLLHDRDFDSAISVGTGEVKKVQKRFSAIENFLKEYINDKRTKAQKL